METLEESVVFMGTVNPKGQLARLYSHQVVSPCGMQQLISLPRFLASSYCGFTFF